MVAPRWWGGGALTLFAAVAFGFHNVIAGAALAGGSEPLDWCNSLKHPATK